MTATIRKMKHYRLPIDILDKLKQIQRHEGIPTETGAIEYAINEIWVTIFGEKKPEAPTPCTLCTNNTTCTSPLMGLSWNEIKAEGCFRDKNPCVFRTLLLRENEFIIYCDHKNLSGKPIQAHLKPLEVCDQCYKRRRAVRTREKPEKPREPKKPVESDYITTYRGKRMDVFEAAELILEREE